jgi:hypothetical protein
MLDPPPRFTRPDEPLSVRSVYMGQVYLLY